ncbi:hypothetical protein P872_23640 [Rhodonellum psychrophilum GCM71 = DSM 17998]|uniref:Uncharacterized protein n=1 Tax=Rhodonellum psychrophilum GCM71 = DSM 17998 TaxID=1123057 RepID=U5C6X0_9BACT|nr:hypothetical protein P872_23640 [Rhodonellum psychrophilum GCM71 = DSM 17998]
MKMRVGHPLILQGIRDGNHQKPPRFKTSIYQILTINEFEMV